MLTPGSERFNAADFGEVVPALNHDGTGWTSAATGEFSYRGKTYSTYAYRPRNYTDFARIERCVEQGDIPAPNVLWRVLRRDNRTEIFGADPSAREADPEDPTRIASWLLTEEVDARNNVVRYTYLPDPAEDGRLHLSKVQYGRYVDAAGAEQWHFHIVFDFSARGVSARRHCAYQPPKRLFHREDTSTSYANGFAQTTSLLCGNVLLYHQFGNRAPFLVRALHLDYEQSGAATHLVSATTYGVRRGSKQAEIRALPTQHFRYSSAASLGQFEPLKDKDGASLGDVIDQVLDLNRNGLPGLLINRGRNLHYAAPLGQGRFATPEHCARLPVAVAEGDSAFSLTSLDGDTRMALVDHHADRRGFYRLTAAGISELQNFERYTNGLEN